MEVGVTDVIINLYLLLMANPKGKSYALTCTFQLQISGLVI